MKITVVGSNGQLGQALQRELAGETLQLLDLPEYDITLFPGCLEPILSAQPDVVIHAAAMGDLPPTPDTIRNATRSAMELAREHQILSIAFPVLGSGVGGFPFNEAARIMVEEIKAFTVATPEMETVVFYGFTAEHAATLQRHLY